MKILYIFIFFIFSFAVNAQTNNNIGFFVKNEIHDSDYISGIGVEAWLINEDTQIGFAVNSSIGKAEVTDEYDYQHSYVAWDLGVKFGYFSDVFIYAELGLDLGELILQDRDEDDYDDEDNQVDLGDILGILVLDDYYDEYDRSNDIDAYVGVGVGLKLENIVIEGYSRYRQIDGEYWKANNQVFTGVKLTMMF